MTDDEYINQLKAIRAQLSDAHRASVSKWPSSSPRSDLDLIVKGYENIAALDRVIMAEEARRG